jgi:broad specificity phosphatase PhoE
LFPSVPVEIWPIEEFTYLEPSKCANTTVIERKAWVDRYWANADPGYVDGFGAESFLEFVGRARSFLDQLAVNPAADILIFSHGQFLNLVAWLIEREPVPIDGQAMAEWRRYEIDHHVPNGCGYMISRGHGNSPWVLGDSIDLDGSVRPSGLASSISPARVTI